MVRTLLQLPEKTHQALKHLAVDRHKSVAELIRNAIDRVYKEDLADIRHAEKLLALFKPGTGISLENFHHKRNRHA